MRYTALSSSSSTQWWPALTGMLIRQHNLYAKWQDYYIQPRKTVQMLRKTAKNGRNSTLVQFPCVIPCFQSAPVARGRIQMCVFFFTVRRRRWGASEPITAALGAGRVWTVVVMENGQFSTHNSSFTSQLGEMRLHATMSGKCPAAAWEGK